MGLSVTNFTIENANGQTVREDIQACLRALQGQNQETSDITTQSQCVAGMTFLNTTSNEWKIRNSSNQGFTTIGNINVANLGLLPAAGGTMTGQLLADDSNSAAAPAISFDTDADLGLFRKSANTMGFSAGGTERLIMDGTGITLQERNHLRFADSDSSHYVGFQAPSTITSNKVWVLPAADTSVAGYALI